MRTDGQQRLLLAPLVREAGVGLRVGPAVMLNAGVHRLRQIDQVFCFLGVRRDHGFDDLDAVEVLHLAVAKLHDDRAVEAVETLDLHDVRIDAAAMSVLVSFVAG